MPHWRNAGWRMEEAQSSLWGGLVLSPGSMCTGCQCNQLDSFSPVAYWLVGRWYSLVSLVLFAVHSSSAQINPSSLLSSSQFGGWICENTAWHRTVSQCMFVSQRCYGCKLYLSWEVCAHVTCASFVWLANARCLCHPLLICGVSSASQVMCKWDSKKNFRWPVSSVQALIVYWCPACTFRGRCLFDVYK